MIRFAHIADTHLGYRQYGSVERAIDFAQAFMRAVKIALENNVDFVIIAGDLFHRKSEMDPLTLTQAIKILEKIREAGIPVFAVEGNHDSAYFRESFSWIDYLAQQKLLINLKPSFDDGIVVEEWDGNCGAYADLDIGVRIYGMKYYGSMTEKVLEMYSKKVRKLKNGLTIFIAHAGIEGYVKIHGCVPSTRFHRLGVDYVALGHIHRSFVEGKIHNPGSLEVCDVSELSFERGFFIVEYDGDLRAKLLKVPTRDFLVINHKIREEKDIEELKKKLSVKVKEPVIYINLKCPKNIRRLLSEERIKSYTSHLSPIVVKLRWDTVDDTFKPLTSNLNREDIELRVLAQLLESYPYGSIEEDVVRLKNGFSKSFDLKRIDDFVEDLLFNLQKGKVDENIKHSDVSDSDVSVEIESTDEVWDWRKAYDTRNKANKR
jgi:DNA repair exonuclease SbcCD nuclease subunit